ncbi:hypothetical protein PISMIDRAFT_680755 [Pisolithus microcarpus 441]|uniref:Uncharacterized protein n=1 Tax=Pisolithus microcarpus 441 TaxID=765257 RepID=A0A0C9YBC4_9AGAM|nr:hypothetical protein BKA83DRAFT_680755 [Pisolithus microcarpus]KIK21995.1 hypothetical protein PISMIDRAFT_680755 [Pisolithus microcarpus 441]
MRFVWCVIEWLLDEVEFWDCPRRRELWLRIIEGDDDDDNLWLWVDDDEDWLTKQNTLHWGFLGPADWLGAQSALRRRVTQKRCPPATARNEKVRNATPEQRIYVIAWLIASSKGVAELFTSHGCTPPTFRTPKLASTLGKIVCKNWDVLPSQTDDWTTALRRSKEDGCICSPADCRGMREWFDMMVWLEDRTPTLVVGDKPCVRCRSLLKSRYEDIAANCAVTSHVSLLDAIEGYCNSELYDSPLRPLSPTVKLLVGRTLEPLMKKHGCDAQYLPPVNRYPEHLRPRVRQLLCGTHINGQDDLPISELPDDIFVGASDPWVVVGITFDCDFAVEDVDLHDHDWHNCFSSFLRCSLQSFDMPVLPLLSSTGLALCHALDHDYSEQRFFCQSNYDTDDSHWVKSDQDGQQLRLTTAVIVAVTTFLRNKKDVDLRSCRRCQVVCMEFFAAIPSSVGFEVANSGDRDNALGPGLSSPLEGSSELGMQEPTGMEASTSMLRNPALLKDEICSRLIGELHRLRQYLDSFGLDTLKCPQRSGSGSKLRLGESTLPRHLPGRSISSSSTRSKSDKVEEIKDKLLGMLRELNLPYERLPWYTLEKDLKKHGCTLVNWPAGVLRKRGNRGIHDLSAVEVSTLYDAITRPDESCRLRICRCPPTLTVVPVQPVDHTSATASGSKRHVPEEADVPGRSSKRLRFRDMTSKVSQQHSGNPQAGGTSEP